MIFWVFWNWIKVNLHIQVENTYKNIYITKIVKKKKKNNTNNINKWRSDGNWKIERDSNNKLDINRSNMTDNNSVNPNGKLKDIVMGRVKRSRIIRKFEIIISD